MSSSSSLLAALAWIPREALLDRPLIHELSAEEKAMLASLPPDAPALPAEADDVDLNASALKDLALNQDDLEMDEENDSDLGSDVEDHYLKSTDLVLVTASVEDDHSTIEMHVYDTESGSLYVHHDISLPALPLVVEFIGCRGTDFQWSQKSSAFVAVGTFEPDIEIWTLDVLDVLEPNAILKGHTDAVLALSWNAHHTNLLASGSADNRCLLWDLSTSTVAKTFEHHSDKVQSVAWNPAEHSVLLTAAFDRTVCILDARAPDKVSKHKTRSSDVEDAIWDVHNPAVFAVATEDGFVSMYDVRSNQGALLAWSAHNKSCSSVAVNHFVKDLWATCSTDKTMKIWDLQQGEPKCLGIKKAGVGKLFSCEFARGATVDPLLLAGGGSEGLLALWHAKDEIDLDPARISEAPKVWESTES